MASSSMSGSKAVLSGAVLTALTALLLLLALVAAGVTQFTGPQMLTASALWIGGGYYAGSRAGEAGTLHGLLAGLAGGLVTAGSLSLIPPDASTPLIGNLAARGSLLLGIIGGFWGAIGGMSADIVRAVKARRA